MKEGSEGDGSTSDSKDSENKTNTTTVGSGAGVAGGKNNIHGGKKSGSGVSSSGHGLGGRRSHNHSLPHIGSNHNLTRPLGLSTTNGGGGGGAGNVVGGLSPESPLLRAFSENRGNQSMGATLAAIGAEVAAAAAAAAAAVAASSTGDHPALSPLGSSFTSTLLGASKNNGNSSSGQRSRAASSSAGEDTNGGSGIGRPALKGGLPSTTPPPDQSTPSPGSVTGPAGLARDKVFICAVCNRCFGYKHVLQNHERTHTGEKPFECKECHKRFTRDHHLKTHMRLHTGEKPYHCTHCERQFVQVANLRRHLRVHTGERPYACELCSSRFSDSNQLKAHMLIHKGEKPFECKKCLGRFRRRHHLMHHKCPKEEMNIGKPRRGRRPKAYDALVPLSPSSRLGGVVGGGPPPHGSRLLAGTAAAALTGFSSSVVAHEPPSAIRAAGELGSLGTLTGGAIKANSNCTGGGALTAGGFQQQQPGSLQVAIYQPPMAHSSNMIVERPRRKPTAPVRILTPQQREQFLRDKESMQTTPIDMSLSPTPDGGPPGQLAIMPSDASRYAPSSVLEGVLDLSNSRSDDSEAEPIEEDVEDVEEEELLDEDLYEDEDDELMDMESTGGGGGCSEEDSRGPLAAIRAATLRAVRISSGSTAGVTWEKNAVVLHNHHHLHHRDDSGDSHRLNIRDNGEQLA